MPTPPAHAEDGGGDGIGPGDCASTTGEPAFTTFHSGIQTCVDYVWYTPDVLRRVGLLECLPYRTLLELGTLPSRGCPSDHMALVVDLHFTP
jgi:mRNA deadenylase 3'-5' endonuclease subunit Ccr4